MAGKKLKDKIEQTAQEEAEEASGELIIDTSDVMSSDQNVGSGSAEEAKFAQKESSDTLITYNKIRQHAILCLQNLFKISSKALFNYWYILFPSFMMKTQGNFVEFLKTDDLDCDKFSSSV